ncbi:glycosyltransferase family 2 protein [Candidatus Kapabacteria bacterium]|nr:glycosyltransferase family 2 protein [Candidatus Kapabacteria bacterium]
MNNYITACLIVKDEEKNLEKCLISIRHLCSQIVVVDTGSSDKTSTIASRYGCEIYFKKWNNDFAEARNFAISHARNDWILSIDADEYIKNFEIDKTILNNDNIGGINLNIINYLDDKVNGPISEHRYTRLFRNNQKIKFEGKIHEQIRLSIESLSLDIVDSDLIIYHTGYVNTSIEKRERNRDLLENAVKENNEDWNVYHLAESQFALKNNGEAKSLYSQILNSKELNIDQIEKAKIRLGQIALDEENYIEVESLLDFKASDKNLEGFRIFVLAAAQINNKKYREAKNLYFSKEITESNLVDKEIVNKAKSVLEQFK